jgi:zinc transport system ATP-binding protein
MRDGRVAYDGPPIAAFTEVDAAHAHHHPDLGRPASDHRPTVASPLDRTTEERT